MVRSITLAVTHDDVVIVVALARAAHRADDLARVELTILIVRILWDSPFSVRLVQHAHVIAHSHLIVVHPPFGGVKLLTRSDEVSSRRAILVSGVCVKESLVESHACEAVAHT